MRPHARLAPRQAFARRCALALAMGLAAAAPSPADPGAAFRALHGASPSPRTLEPDAAINKNRVIAEVFAFYSKVDQRLDREQVRVHLDDGVRFRVIFGKTLSEAEGYEGFAEKLEGIYAKYPRVDRTLDRFEVAALPGGGYRATFRLTSLVLREDSSKVRLALRAGMRFDYRETDDGRLVITDYEARPKLSTLPKTLWELARSLFL